MRIETIEVFPVKIRKEHVYLGETTTLDSPYDYYMRPEYRCPYSKNMETLLVKITTQSGIFGVRCSKNESDSIRMKIGK